MLKNYFTIALRNLQREKYYALIKIAGLGLALSLCILLYLCLHNEWTRDTFYTHAEQIYRVRQVGYLSSDSLRTAGPGDVRHYLPVHLGKSLATDLPEITAVVRLKHTHGLLLHDDLAFDQHGLWADPQLFTMFTFPLVRGAETTVLARPDAIVLSQTAAAQYFGDADPVGQELVLRLSPTNVRDVVVTGVMRDVHPNSSLHFDFVLPIGDNDIAPIMTFVQTQVTDLDDRLQAFDEERDGWIYHLQLQPAALFRCIGAGHRGSRRRLPRPGSLRLPTGCGA